MQRQQKEIKKKRKEKKKFERTYMITEAKDS